MTFQYALLSSPPKKKPHLFSWWASPPLESPSDLIRHSNIDAQLVTELEQQARILLELATDGDEIEAVVDDLASDIAFLDAAYCADEQLVADGIFDLVCESLWGGGRKRSVSLEVNKTALKK